MKQWEKPKISVLGVDSTFEDISPLDSWGNHVCHREPGEHSGNCSTGNGHKAITIGSCPTHTTGIADHEGYSCCCYDPNGTIPPLS